MVLQAQALAQVPELVQVQTQVLEASLVVLLVQAQAPAQALVVSPAALLAQTPVAFPAVFLVVFPVALQVQVQEPDPETTPMEDMAAATRRHQDGQQPMPHLVKAKVVYQH